MPRPRTAAIDQRGDTFRVRITVAGKRHTFTVPTKSRRAAQLFAAAKLAELEREHERTALGSPSAQRFSEVLRTIEAEEFSTLTPGGRRSYQDSLGPIRTYFVEQLQDPPVDKIVAKHITGYLSWRRVHPLCGTEPLSNRTLQRTARSSTASSPSPRRWSCARATRCAG